MKAGRCNIVTPTFPFPKTRVDLMLVYITATWNRKTESPNKSLLKRALQKKKNTACDSATLLVICAKSCMFTLVDVALVTVCDLDFRVNTILGSKPDPQHNILLFVWFRQLRHHEYCQDVLHHCLNNINALPTNLSPFRGSLT